MSGNFLPDVLTKSKTQHASILPQKARANSPSGCIVGYLYTVWSCIAVNGAIKS